MLRAIFRAGFCCATAAGERRTHAIIALILAAAWLVKRLGFAPNALALTV